MGPSVEVMCLISLILRVSHFDDFGYFFLVDCTVNFPLVLILLLLLPQVFSESISRSTP